MNNKKRIGFIGNIFLEMYKKNIILNEIEMMDSLVEFGNEKEHCILPEHYEELANNIFEKLKNKKIK